MIKRPLLLLLASCVITYFVISYAVNYSILIDQKILPNGHGAVLLDSLRSHFEQYKKAGPYVYISSEREHVSTKDPHMRDEEGRLVLIFTKASKYMLSQRPLKIVIKHYDKTENLKMTYDAVCSRRALENCTPLLVDAQIVNYPEILSSMTNALKDPCGSWFFTKDGRAGMDPWNIKCKENHHTKVFGKVALGLIDEESNLVEVITIPPSSNGN